MSQLSFLEDPPTERQILGDAQWSLAHGDCRAVLSSLPESIFDSAVCDPPYELEFMGKHWDRSGVAFDPKTWAAVLRVLKPGAHLLAFGGTRTYHRMTCAIEDAGFEIRDSLDWIYGTGFPKSLTHKTGMPEGQGTALKPGREPIVLARKPVVGTVAENVAQWGTGGLNIDACRVGTTKDVPSSPTRTPGTSLSGSVDGSLRREAGEESGHDPNVGRWPANVLLDEAAAAELDAQSGIRKAGERPAKYSGIWGNHNPENQGERVVLDSGGASRFFYVAKPSRKERDLGCEHLQPKTAGEATGRQEGSAGITPRAGAGRTGGAHNHHPTVKPVALMRYLVRLVTPVGGTVLDPFAGSGTTGMAARLEDRRFLGIELESEYLEIARLRIEAAR